ncbi:MAG: 4-hydroxy-3-methylbut-2-enyl diphosphate reductase, partial [bacterium]
VTTFHIAEPECLLSGSEIRHRPIGLPSTANVAEITTCGWLPSGNLRVGLTAGASTPNNLVGQVIERLEMLTVNDLRP